MSNKPRTELREHSQEVVIRSKAGTVQFESPGFEIPVALVPSFAVAGHTLKITVTLEDPHTRGEWARAYAKQGASDLLVYAALANDASIQECHCLHYLQMASEKIARGYLLLHTLKPLGSLLSTHIALEEFIRMYEKSHRYRIVGRNEQFSVVMKDVRALASEIERLAPAVDRQSSPTNAEYPWSNGVHLTIPCEYSYQVMRSFNKSTWNELVNILGEASRDLSR